MDRIHYRPDEKGCEMACGTKKIRSNEKFLGAIVNKIVDQMNVSFNDRRIVEGLLETSLKTTCFQLLEDFLHIELEILADTVSKKLDVRPVVNYNHATHAKFCDMLEEHILKFNGKISA